MERMPAVAADVGTHVQGGRARSLELIAAVDEAFSCGDWPGLRRLYHDDALLCTVAAHERIVGPDELMEVFAGLAGTVYSIGSTQTVAIDDAAVVVSGQLRYPLEHGGIADSPKVWLLTFEDDLVYRSRAYRSVTEAREAYERHGIGLGLDEDLR